jgi:hypothetical protein
MRSGGSIQVRLSGDIVVVVVRIESFVVVVIMMVPIPTAREMSQRPILRSLLGPGQVPPIAKHALEPLLADRVRELVVGVPDRIFTHQAQLGEPFQVRPPETFPQEHAEAE